VAGRKRVLTRDLVAELAANLTAHGSLETACAKTGVSARSVRRWRAEGRRELDGLSPEAQLELAVERHQREAARESPGWESIAEVLAANERAWADLVVGDGI
jgi:hypothetical protein